MLLTITNTQSPATDLGWLLHKRPDKVQTFKTTGGTATVFYPEATDDRCTAALLVSIDPIALVRGAGPNGHVISADYVNDRPYVTSSLLSSALANVFSSALNGRCNDRPALPAEPLPLVVTLAVVRVSAWPRSAGSGGLTRVFEPLGYTVEAVRHPLDDRFPDWGLSPYFTVTLRHTITVQTLLEHLYILLPVLDNSRHSFVQEQDVDVLVRKGGNWLPSHPERTTITRRFLRRQAGLTQLALDRLMLADEAPAGVSLTDDMVVDGLTLNSLVMADDADTAENPAPVAGSVFPMADTPLAEAGAGRRVTLHDLRLDAVLAGLVESGARSVLDLGCGEGQLLRRLLARPQFGRIAGMDVSYRELLRAKSRLHYDELPPAQRDRLTLLHGSLLYRDQRLEGFDAAALVEVIEHVEPGRLPDLARVVFGPARCSSPRPTPSSTRSTAWPRPRPATPTIASSGAGPSSARGAPGWASGLGMKSVSPAWVRPMPRSGHRRSWHGLSGCRLRRGSNQTARFRVEFICTDTLFNRCYSNSGLVWGGTTARA
jgi:SAM-dependent methyltransferase